MEYQSQGDERGGGLLAWILLFALIPGGLTIAVGGRRPDLLLVDVCLVSVFCVLLFRAFLGRFRFDFSDTPILLLVNAYIFANLLSMLFSLRDIGRGVVAIKIFLFGYLTFISLVSTVRSERALRRSLYAISIWSAVVGIMLTYQFFTQWQTDLNKGDVGLSMGQSNYLAAMLVPVFPISVGLWVTERGLLKRLLLGATCCVTLIGLLITMSRGALGSLLLAGICTTPWLLKAGLKIKHILISLAVLSLLALLVPGDLLSANYNLFLLRLDNPDLGRLALWGIAWDKFTENPLLGVGPNCIYIYNVQVMPYVVLHTHNFVLNNLAEVGITGSVPFFLLVALLVKRAYRLCAASLATGQWKAVSLGIFVGLFATLLHGMVEPTFPGAEYSIVFWTLVAIMSLLHRTTYSTSCQMS